MVTATVKLKDACSLEEKLCKPRQRIKKQSHYFAYKGPSSQGYGVSSSQVWMWELGHKEGWTLKNWCFWTVVLKKTLESPLDCKDIKPVNPKGSQPWILIGKFDAEAEAPILWTPDAKKWLTGKDPDVGKDWRREEKGLTEDEMVGWHHQFNGHEFEQTLGDGEGQESMVCCSPRGQKESDTTEQLNNKVVQAQSWTHHPWCLLIEGPSTCLNPSWFEGHVHMPWPLHACPVIISKFLGDITFSL